jgi:replicative DNA helicase
MRKKHKPKDEGSESITHIKQTLDNAFLEMDQYANDTKGEIGIEEGFTFLNQLFIGNERPRFSIISTPNMSGSSFLGPSIVAELATTHGRSIACFSLEIPQTFYSLILLSIVAEVDFEAMRSGRLRSEQWPGLSAACRDLIDTQIYLDDVRPLSVKALRKRIRKLITEVPIDLVIIDSLDFISCKKLLRNRARKYQKICQSLKDISDELNVSILLMSQFSDEYVPDDIDVTKECGSLTFLQDFGKIPDAELCLIPGKQDREGRIFSLHICRNREGVTGTIDLKQNLSGGSFGQYWE